MSQPHCLSDRFRRPTPTGQPYVRLVLSGIVLAMVCGNVSLAADRPNILFIFTDDQNYKTLSCYPEAPDWVSTPHIDALASQGIRFERGYYGAWCMPSRASFLTGRLQHAVQSMRMEGTYPGSAYDPEQCRFWPSVMRRQGYHTAHVGKWHTGVDSGQGRDWDHQIVWNRPAHPHNSRNYFTDQIVSFNGRERRVGGYSTDNYTDWAIDYIKGQNRDTDKPWYLWLCYGAVHGPTTPADRHSGSLTARTAPVPQDIFGPWPEKADFLSRNSAWQRGSDGRPRGTTKRVRGRRYDDWVLQYNECALAIDEGVGRLMAALRESGQLANTLIVFTSDQGYALGEHGLNQKVAPYDGSMAAPLIIAHAGRIPQGKVCRHAVNAPDLVRLMCDTAGVEVPWKTHGRDIRPLLDDPETRQWNDPMLMTHTGRLYGADTDTLPSRTELLQVGEVPWYVLLRHGRYKYIRYLVEGEVEEVYDLHADPEELENLAFRAERQALLKSLRATAIAELRRTDAKIVAHLPPTAAMKNKDWPAAR